MAARKKAGDAAGEPSGGGAESVRKGPRKPRFVAKGRPNTWTRSDVVFVAVAIALLVLVAIPEMEGGVLLPPRSPLAVVVVASGGWIGLVAAAWFVHRSSWFRRDTIARHGERARDPMSTLLVAGLMAAGFAAGWYATHRAVPQWATRLWGEERTRPALLLALSEIPTRRLCKHPAVVRFPDRPEPFETCYLPEAVRAQARVGDTLLLAVREGGLGIQVEDVLALRKFSP
jgi:hypothetical protein